MDVFDDLSTETAPKNKDVFDELETPPSRGDRKSAVTSELVKARIGGFLAEQGRAIIGAAGNITGTAAIPAQPVLKLPEPTGTGVVGGLERVGKNLAEGASAPAYWLLPQARIIKALTAGQMLGHLPESVPNAVRTIQDPNATVAQKIEAGSAPVIEAGFGAGLARNRVTPPTDLTEPVMGSQIQMPEGAVPPQVPRAPKPTVPGTPAEPRLSAAEEVRQKGADTVQKIVDLFPALKEGGKARERAREIGKAAWGQNWPEQPVPKPKPPGEPPAAAEPTQPPPEPPSPAPEPPVEPPVTPEPVSPAPVVATSPTPTPEASPAPVAPALTLGIWPESDWTLAGLKDQSVKERADKARFLGLRNKDGGLETGFKKLADAGAKRIQDLKAPKPETKPDVFDTVDPVPETEAPVDATKQPVPETAAPEPATVSPPVPKPEPEVAAVKVKKQIQKVAATEGQRPAKEVKSELVSRLEKAIEDAPAEADLTDTQRDALAKAKEKLNIKRPEAYSKSKQDQLKAEEEFRQALEAGYAENYSAAEKTGLKRISIEIPGDGTFTIWNTKESVSEMLNRAKKLGTDPGRTPTPRRSGISKEDQVFVEQQLVNPGTSPEPGPGMVGMGAADITEVQGSSPRDMPTTPTYGVAARVLEQRRQRGVIAPVEPGEGISPEAQIQRGRDLLNAGADPEAIMSGIEHNKARFNDDDASILRAHGEILERKLYAAVDKHGVYSDQAEKAWEANSDWSKRFKALPTMWHRIGQALQGETEIDTGTFIGLRKAYFDLTGKDFTPEQAGKAQKIAESVQASDKAVESAKQKVATESAKIPGDAIPTDDLAIARKQLGEYEPGKVMTPQQVKVLWNWAKRRYLDKAMTDFEDVKEGIATDFGIPKSDVARALAQPKAIRTITDDMYRKMSEQRRLKESAKNWLTDQSRPGWLKFTRSVPRVFFAAKVFGMAQVGMITHAGLNVFNPSAWSTYWPNFLRQYKLMGLHDQGAYHERMMQELVRDPLYTKARRAGLANDPAKFSDDYQNNEMVKWFRKVGLAGNRGFDALKLFRQARFNQLWNALPESLQTPESSRMLADSVNHATGVVNMPFREWSNWTFFAPKLEASRWAWMVKDPLVAAKTFVDWKDASYEQRHFALAEFKQKATIAATYAGLLALNQGILSASGSDQELNLTNPRKGDFMAFKAGGHNIGIVGPMLGMVRLFANMLHAATGKRGKLEQTQTRFAEMGSTLAEYGRGKLSPFAAFGADVVSQADLFGRPLPFSDDKVPKRYKQEGPYTYGEYAGQTFSPIPVSEALREVWKDQGLSDSQIQVYLNALLTAVVAGGTGARISTPQ